MAFWVPFLLISAGGLALWKGQQTIETVGDETEDVMKALIPIILLLIIGYIVVAKVK